jgi:Replication-relaxation
MGEGSSPHLYTLTTKGRRILGDEESAKVLPIQGHRFSTSDHTLRINDFRVAISLGCRNGSGLVLKYWMQGRQLRFTPTITIGNIRKVTPIIPDAFFTIRYGGKNFSYFLEIDRGTADLGRIRKKMLAYLGLWHSGVASTKLSIRSFRLLYITSSEKRLENMLSMMLALSQTNRRLGICSLTTFGRYSLYRPERLMEPIWLSIDHSGNILRTCPFPGLIPSTLPIVPGNPPVREPDA